MATVGQALDDLEKTLKEALEVPDSAQIRKLKVDGNAFTGEVSVDGELWYPFVVDENGSEIFESP